MSILQQDIYFVYKLNWISQIGGVMPEVKDATTQLSLSVHGDWHLGKTKNTEYIYQIREHNPIVCPKIVADGWGLIGLTEITEIDQQTGNETTRPLTAQEQAAQAAATKFYNKINVRTVIKSTESDIEDIVADLSKQIDILQKIIIALFDKVENSTAIPQDIIDTISTAKTFSTPLDSELLSNSMNTIMSKLGNRKKQVKDILDTNYYNK